jgi:hypothetical protein
MGVFMDLSEMREEQKRLEDTLNYFSKKCKMSTKKFIKKFDGGDELNISDITQLEWKIAYEKYHAIKNYLFINTASLILDNFKQTYFF